MKKSLSLLVGGLFAGIAATAQANHLGPIEYGKNREEIINYCIKLSDSKLVVIEQEKSIEKGESYEDYKKRTAPLFKDLRCGINNVLYTPDKAICEGKTYVVQPDGNAKIDSATIVKSSSFGIEFYAFLYDEVPDKPPSCLEIVK